MEEGAHLREDQQMEMVPWEWVPFAGIPPQQVSREQVRVVAYSNDGECRHTGRSGME